MALRLFGLSLLCAGLAGSGCSEETTTSAAPGGPTEPTVLTPPRPDSMQAAQSGAPASRIFFGDLHVHSSWSFDAYGAGVTARPAYAYQYARGEAIPHLSGQDIQLLGPPLDFVALTDHAEYLGLPAAAATPDHPLRQQPLIKTWQAADPVRKEQAWQKIVDSYRTRKGLPALMSDAVVVPAWRALVNLANKEYRPGRFTTFVGFEYTPEPQHQNLHRNVLFRGAAAPARPYSSMDSSNPEDLWAWMDGQRAAGRDVLAIPHNSNGSNGQMFSSTRFDGSPIDAAWTQLRARNEPVAEVFQIKGQSETHPALSPGDEWADFEIADWRTTATNLASEPGGSYVRDALKRGLALEAQWHTNPFALGMIGSTDGHMSSSPFEESNFTGKIGLEDATPAGRLAYIRSSTPGAPPTVAVGTRWSAAGLAGIWAPENTRAAIFDALRRRETFATSGPRIRVRVVGGWHFETGEVADSGIISPAGQRAAMGGQLARPAPSGGSTPLAPSFLVSALQDPLDAPLDRIQIVKGWVDPSQSPPVAHERIYDVACASGRPPHPRTHRCDGKTAKPDPANCITPPNAGASELRAKWTDPDDHPNQSAFYYVRVLQVPSCRWSTYDAIRLGRPPHPAVPPTLQERAVTSPIWVGPVSDEVPVQASVQSAQ